MVCIEVARNEYIFGDTKCEESCEVYSGVAFLVINAIYLKVCVV